LVDFDSTICRADLAFLVLAEAGLDTRTPLRRAAVRVGENISLTGWGHTSDVRDALPSDRSTLDSIPVAEVGPGLIPPGMFAIGGNTGCLGDSGAAALIDRAAVGVYSVIMPSPDQCTVPETKNLFQGLAAQSDLVVRAFAAIGETPWYVDPLATDAGGDVRPDANPSEPDAGERSSSPASDQGCRMARRRPGGGGALLAVGLAALAACARARRRRAAKRGA
jgi:hypothetical protein